MTDADFAPHSGQKQSCGHVRGLTEGCVLARHGGNQKGDHHHERTRQPHAKRIHPRPDGTGEILGSDHRTTAHSDPRIGLDDTGRSLGLDGRPQRDPEREQDRQRTPVSEPHEDHRGFAGGSPAGSAGGDLVPRLYTTAEVAAMLRVHRNTVDKERKRGRLVWTPVGTCVRFTAEQVRAYINDQEG